MLRRLHHDQPASFAFTPANQAWAEAEMRKYPEGRQASAVIALLFRAQEQEGWVTKPMIEHVADMLDMPRIRVLEVATFYTMLHLHPVGSVAHVQVCGTLSCLLCGSEDLISVCKAKIAPEPRQLSADGRFSWEEVECLGACANAPMIQIGKDYYEDLTAERLEWLLDELAAGRQPLPGPQNGRYAAEPLGGLTTLKDYEAGRAPHNAAVTLAVERGDGMKRIDGTEVPLLTPWLTKGANHNPGAAAAAAPAAPAPAPRVEGEKLKPVRKPGPAPKKPAAAPAPAAAAGEGRKPEGIAAPRGGQADDLKEIEGIGPALERLCHEMGIFHFDQIAAWGPEEIAWMDGNLKGFRGRISRDKWVAQAKLIVDEGLEAFRIRAKTNDY
ncbi:MAG: NADH-quinone oxidoreductase subunit E [Rubellimicrobium sp.]|nr:NADH-quinone oxidoreductase subunit E [Rubellimicrobium sp.]